MSITKMVEKKSINFREGPDCVVWEITLACNFRCLHCGVNAAYKRENELTLNECFKICEELRKIKAKVITLMGGELFLRKDWYQIAKKINSLGMKLTIVSNGFLITEKIINDLKKLNLWYVVFSLDGGNSLIHDKIRGVKGAFEKVLNAIDLSINNGIKTGIITTVHKINLFELPKIREIVLSKNGKLKWQIQVASYHGGRMKPSDRLTQEEFYFVGAFINETLAKYSFQQCPLMGAHDIGYFSSNLKFITKVNKELWGGCTAGINTLGISSNGNIKGCLSLSDKFIEGNIRNKSLVKIWNNPKSFQLNRNFNKKFLEGFCAQCKYGKICEGGCSDLACSFSGSPYNDPYCFYRIEQKYHKKNLKYL